MSVRLPETWYSTPAELAAEWGVHADRILYYADAGLLEPAALLPKGMLPLPTGGPAPHVVVPLPNYRSMEWHDLAGERVAPLAGDFRAFEVDGGAFRNFTLSGGDDVVVCRSQLVITIDQREALEAMCEAPRSINPTERRNLLRLLGVALAKGFPEQIGKPHALAAILARELEFSGESLSRQAIAPKIEEALALRPEEFRVA